MSHEAVIEKIFAQPTYGVPKAQKAEALSAALTDLEVFHTQNCAPYADILQARPGARRDGGALSDRPFLPVRLFKSHLLASVPEADRYKVLTSSGTTGQQVSRIVLDTVTSRYQSRAIVQIMQEYIGKQRLPMLIIDHPSVVKRRESFSARGAGILGLSNFGRNHTYALKDDTMEIDWDAIEAFREKYDQGPVFIFGFTFMVWQYFVEQLRQSGRKLSLDQGILVHSGGWKKLQDRAVDNATFKRVTQDWTGIARIHNFYGMVEQVGSVFVECEHGFLHAPSFADVLIRDPDTWDILPEGQTGLIQVLSCLPHSYPGHSLLTEDLGVLHGEDTCTCGRKGKYFSVLGRLPKAEARGCSDTAPER